MRKTVVSIALASVLGLGAAAAMAYPNMGPGMGPGPHGVPCHPQCVGRHMPPPPPMMDRVEHVKASYAALERMMGLRDNQKAAWAAYTGARVKAAEERREAWAKNKTPALDQQTILERRVERLKSELKNLESVTEKRAALMKVLDASQNVALDQYESHRGMRKHGMRKGPGMGPRGFGPKGPGPQGKAPGPQGDPAAKDGARPL